MVRQQTPYFFFQMGVLFRKVDFSQKIILQVAG